MDLTCLVNTNDDANATTDDDAHQVSHKETTQLVKGIKKPITSTFINIMQYIDDDNKYRRPVKHISK